MPRRLLCLVAFALVLALSGCAAPQSESRRDLSSIRKIAVSYAPADASGSGEPSVAGRIVGRAVRHGVSIGLGSLQLGLFAGLIGDVADLSHSSSKKDGSDVSREVLAILSAAKTDPGWLVAQRTQAEVARGGRFTISRTNPDALFDFELWEARIEPVDRLGLQQRAVLGVKARLRDRAGAVVWNGQSAATSARSRTWQEYRERPARLRAEFDALARVVARDLVADLQR